LKVKNGFLTASSCWLVRFVVNYLKIDFRGLYLRFKRRLCVMKISKNTLKFTVLGLYASFFIFMFTGEGFFYGFTYNLLNVFSNRLIEPLHFRGRRERVYEQFINFYI